MQTGWLHVELPDKILVTVFKKPEDGDITSLKFHWYQNLSLPSFVNKEPVFLCLSCCPSTFLPIFTYHSTLLHEMELK